MALVFDCSDSAQLLAAGQKLLHIVGPTLVATKHDIVIEGHTVEVTSVEQIDANGDGLKLGGQGEGVDRKIIVTGNDADGVERTEVFVDARDVEQGDTAKLTERATQATIPAAQTVSASAVADANLVCGVDYNLGPGWRLGLFGTYYDYDTADYSDLELELARALGNKELGLRYSMETGRLSLELGGFGLGR